MVSFNPRTDGPTQISRERNPPPFAAKQHLHTHEESPSTALSRFFLHLRQLLMVVAKTLLYKRKERKKDETTPLSFSYQVPCDALPWGGKGKGNRNFPVEEREREESHFPRLLTPRSHPNIGFGSILLCEILLCSVSDLGNMQGNFKKYCHCTVSIKTEMTRFHSKKFFCIFVPSSTTPPLRIHPFRFMFIRALCQPRRPDLLFPRTQLSNNSLFASVLN